MSKYTNAFTQVYVILNQLEDEDYEKIPPEIIGAIRENSNKEYQFEIDENIELKDNDLLPETRALLFKIYRDYLATPQQKQKIIKIQNEERIKNEQRKKQQYNTDVFLNKAKLEEKTEQATLVACKENIFKLFLKTIKNFFVKNK